MLESQFRLFPDQGFQLFAQIDDGACGALVEGIENGGLAADPQAHQEMAGKIDPLDLPVQCAGGLDIENGQGDRQAAPPVDHPAEIGILQIVIGRFVAAIAMPCRHHVSQHVDARRQDSFLVIAREIVELGKLAQVLTEPGEMLPVGAEVDFRPVQGSTGQGGSRQVDGFFRLGTDCLQVSLRRGNRIGLFSTHVPVLMSLSARLFVSPEVGSCFRTASSRGGWAKGRRQQVTDESCLNRRQGATLP